MEEVVIKVYCSDIEMLIAYKKIIDNWYKIPDFVRIKIIHNCPYEQYSCIPEDTVVNSYQGPFGPVDKQEFSE